MEEETFSIKICQGLNKDRCHNVLPWQKELEKRLRATIQKSGWPEFIKGKIKGHIKAHQKFRISVAGCPNSCSQPHISDFGLIRAVQPEIIPTLCKECGLCVYICEENAVTMEDSCPEINFSHCLYCGSCERICPSQAICSVNDGFRILLGGKLGRHPRLATELGGIFSEEEVMAVLARALELYMKHFSEVKRFGDLVAKKGLAYFAR